MFSLRTLIGLSFAGISTAGLAATQSLSFQLTTSSQNGRVDINDPARLYRIGQVSESLSYRIEGIGSFSAQAGMEIAQPDYSNILIRDADGNERFLSESGSPRDEIRGSASVDYASGPNTVSLGWAGSVSESPFASQSVELEATHGFFNQTSVLGSKFTYANLRQPENFYANQDFQISQRPTEVNAYRVAIHHEQFLSENWKMRNEIAIGRRIEDRPKHLSLATRQGYALTDRLFADLRASYVTEFRSDALQDERGYFQTYGGQIGLHFEPVYDLILSVSYGLYFEREEEPRRESLLQVASDQYGLGAEYRGRAFDIRLQAGFSATNSDTQDFQLSGGITWRI